MLQDRFVTTDEFYAAGATFTLLAWAFAYLYMACQAFIPGSFSAIDDPHGMRTWMELLFLSFTTLSGVGLGDIVPVLPMARALVMLEQLAGVMYIVLVVSRLVGLAQYRIGRTRSDPRAGDDTKSGEPGHQPGSKS
ncbi:Ion channel [compost metagenome]